LDFLNKYGFMRPTLTGRRSQRFFSWLVCK